MSTQMKRKEHTKTFMMISNLKKILCFLVEINIFQRFKHVKRLRLLVGSLCRGFIILCHTKDSAPHYQAYHHLKLGDKWKEHGTRFSMILNDPCYVNMCVDCRGTLTNYMTTALSWPHLITDLGRTLNEPHLFVRSDDGQHLALGYSDVWCIYARAMCIPASIQHWPNTRLMLAQRLTLWPSISQILDYYRVCRDWSKMMRGPPFNLQEGGGGAEVFFK